jgi:hypothetical protein
MPRRALGVAAPLLLTAFGFHDGPVLPIGVTYHTATALPDGRLLIAGGYDAVGNSHDEVWLYEPWTGRLTAGAPMLSAHHFHTATLLRDGRVLVVGGKSGNNQLAFTEFYDPRTDTWTDAGFLSDPRERRFRRCSTTAACSSSAASTRPRPRPRTCSTTGCGSREPRWRRRRAVARPSR